VATPILVTLRAFDTPDRLAEPAALVAAAERDVLAAERAVVDLALEEPAADRAEEPVADLALDEPVAERAELVRAVRFGAANEIIGIAARAIAGSKNSLALLAPCFIFFHTRIMVFSFS
jgi:hypothetical protein